MDREASEALDSVANHLANAVRNHLTQAAKQLAADSIVAKQEVDQAQLKRMPPG
jgi:hypothetical protein